MDLVHVLATAVFIVVIALSLLAVFDVLFRLPNKHDRQHACGMRRWAVKNRRTFERKLRHAVRTIQRKLF